MEYLIALLVALSVALLIVLVVQLVPARPAVIGRRLSELAAVGASPFGADQRRERQARRKKWESVLQELGERAARQEEPGGELRSRLVQAGFQGTGAPAVYWGVRILLPLVLLGIAVFAIPFAGSVGLLAAVCAGVAGWIAPSFYLDSRIRKRQKELRMALPDMLDLMVTAVEAGLGLNQAMVRVGQEIRHVSPEMAKELTMVNLEIRAGKPREEALRGLGGRTGVEDIRSLTAMLIQTERFGTSIADALRVHADAMRVKRRQRAEEEAAKTTVKILFPLLFCIFPALFVVLIGPAAIRIYEELFQVL